MLVCRLNFNPNTCLFFNKLQSDASAEVNFFLKTRRYGFK